MQPRVVTCQAVTPCVPGRRSTTTITVREAGHLKCHISCVAQVYRVVDTHFEGAPTEKLACAVAEWCVGTDQPEGDIMNIQISVKQRQAVPNQIARRKSRRTYVQTTANEHSKMTADTPVFLSSDGNMRQHEAN